MSAWTLAGSCNSQCLLGNKEKVTTDTYLLGNGTLRLNQDVTEVPCWLGNDFSCEREKGVGNYLVSLNFKGNLKPDWWTT